MKIINNKQLVNHLITHLKKHSIEIKKVEFSPAIYEPEFRDGEYFLEKLIEPTNRHNRQVNAN